MRDIIKRVPIPLSGVMLGCAALGNLLQSYSEQIRILLGWISFLLCLLLILKYLLFFDEIREDMKNPIMMSVSATFPMGIMLLSVYAKPYLGFLSSVIWYGAIALHLILICTFTYRFLRKLDIKKVFASYFIVYVGIAVVGITAPAFEMTSIGTAAFWFGFVSLIIMLFLIGYRYIKYPAVPEPAQPLFCIFAAPASLCLTAYLQSVQSKNQIIVISLALLATLLYLLTLFKLISVLRLPFYPSYAAFTFPYVISAIAMKQTMAYLINSDFSIAFMSPIVLAETIIAAALVIYTLIRFIAFLFIKKETEKAKT